MSEQARLVSVEIESEPTLFPQFSPARFVGEKRSEPWKRVSFEPGSWGGEGGDSPMKQKTKEDDEIVVCVQNTDYQPCWRFASRLSQSPFPISAGRSVGVLAVDL